MSVIETFWSGEKARCMGGASCIGSSLPGQFIAR